jgi:Fe-S cluster assembly scaffold protein SufB
VTDAPSGAPAPTVPRPTASARPRRSPTELVAPFVSAETAARVSAALADPKWLADERSSALAAFADLPIESNVLYTSYVDLRSADLTDVELVMPDGRNVPAPGLPPDVAAIITVDGRGQPAVAVGGEARAAGLILESFADWARRDAAGFRSAIAREDALPADDKLAALTRALWTTGVHVELPKGGRLTQPIVVRWTVDGGSALVARTIVELGEDAELQLVEELTSAAAPERVGFFAGTSEARLGPGSNLSFASLQELSDRHVAVQLRTGAVGRAANLHWALAQLGSRLVRSRVDNRLEGDGSSVEQVEIVFGAQDQLFDLTSYTRHVGKDATSNLLSKAALQDSARTFLKGLVTIDKSGSGTDSFLGEYGMNLSKKARAVAIPSLEIDQPDCRRVAHSSSVGPIDESQLFYLESRGIPPDEARKFIVLGFLEPVVARVPLESARERLREALEVKWDQAHPGSSAAA